MSEELKRPIYKRWWFWAIVIIIVIGAIASQGRDDDKREVSWSDVANQLENKTVVDEPNEAERIEGTKEVEGLAELTTVDKAIEERANETLSQQNAVRRAEQYLSIMAFSKSGLISQLEYDGFSNEDATYAVNKLNVDWKEQAVKKAKQYLDLMAFSRSGLIEQLEYEGFTAAEATYAVDQIGF